MLTIMQLNNQSSVIYQIYFKILILYRDKFRDALMRINRLFDVLCHFGGRISPRTGGQLICSGRQIKMPDSNRISVIMPINLYIKFQTFIRRFFSVKIGVSRSLFYLVKTHKKICLKFELSYIKNIFVYAQIRQKA